MEIRKDIVWYEWLYQVSDLGRIRVLARDRKGRYWNIVHNKEQIMKQRRSRNRYNITLNREWLSHVYSIHRLKAIAFIPNPENKPCVNHRDWNPSNNWYHKDWKDNLEWNTYSENVLHWFRSNWRIHPRWMLWIIWEKNVRSKKIYQYSLDWNLIKLRDSVHDVWRSLWYSVSYICKCCRENKWTPHWYIRKYQ